MELKGFDKTHFMKVMRKLTHKEKEIDHASIEKCRQEKASSMINMSINLKLDEVGSIISGNSDSLDANINNDPENLEFVFPSISSDATGAT